MVSLKGLWRVPIKTKHGVKIYYYAWRGGPRIEADFGTPEFLEEFAAAKNPLSGLDRRKFRAWVTLYKASDEYRKLAETTKRVWLPWFDKITDEFGNLSTRQFDRPTIRIAIRHWRNKWKATPRTADFAKQVLSRVCAYAVAEGALVTNMCEGVPNLYSANRAEIIWAADDLALLYKHASAEVAYAAKLASLTGLRQSDLLKLSWTHVKERSIEIPTGKSRRRKTAVVPLTADATAFIATIPKRSTTILTNSDGQPWKGFGSSWNTAMKRSGLAERDLHFHDLRGTAATNYYRAGFTIREIAETLAWSEDRVERLIDRYVKRDEILKDRVRRLEQAEKSLTVDK